MTGRIAHHSVISVTLMRGGTSKGVFVRLPDLPPAGPRRDAVVLRLLGSPDPMQIDGLGGTHSSTSKLVAVATADEARTLGHEVPESAEIAYLFGQVGVDTPSVDWTGNCGNLTSAVAPYATHEGLLPPAPDGLPVPDARPAPDASHTPDASNTPSGRRTVRLFNLNTGRLIDETFAVRDGEVHEDGDFAIAGVPGTAARVDVDVLDPGGSVTGRTLPGGAPTLRLFGLDASVVDVTTPIVLAHAADLGILGTEPRDQLNADAELLARLEALRGAAAVACGLVDNASDAKTASPAVPRVALVSAPAGHVTAAGDEIPAEDCDLVVRMTSMGVVHHACPGTGLMAIAAAAALPGTVAHAITGSRPAGSDLRIAHPKGIAVAAATVNADGDGDEDGPYVASVSMPRTARRLMRGDAYLPAALLP